MATYTWVNKAKLNLSSDYLSRVEEVTKLPTGRLIFVFNDGPVKNELLGICVAQKMHVYAPATSKLFSSISEDWDVGAALSNQACDYETHHPAFFTYLIGHELGHAYTCLTDLELHILTTLIDTLIKDASNGKVTQWHELPHERCFDQFGMQLAAALYTREQLNKEIEKLQQTPEYIGDPRLEVMLNLAHTVELDSLREEVIDFVRPYKTKFIEICKKNTAAREGVSIANEIDLGRILS